MGSLRIVPKHQNTISHEDFQQYRSALKEARGSAMGNAVVWVVEKGKNLNEVRERLLQVAEAEGINVAIRKTRGSHSLAFSFKKKLRIVPRRISAGESRKRILSALAEAKVPLKKAEILRATGLSTSTWNVRIKELLRQGTVVRSGERRESVYVLG